MDPSEESFSRLLSSDTKNPRPDNTSFQHMLNFTPNTFNQSQPPCHHHHSTIPIIPKQSSLPHGGGAR